VASSRPERASSGTAWPGRACSTLAMIATSTSVAPSIATESGCPGAERITSAGRPPAEAGRSSDVRPAASTHTSAGPSGNGDAAASSGRVSCSSARSALAVTALTASGSAPASCTATRTDVPLSVCGAPSTR